MYQQYIHEQNTQMETCQQVLHEHTLWNSSMHERFHSPNVSGVLNLHTMSTLCTYIQSIWIILQLADVCTVTHQTLLLAMTSRLADTVRQHLGWSSGFQACLREGGWSAHSWLSGLWWRECHSEHWSCTQGRRRRASFQTCSLHQEQARSWDTG